MQTLLDILNGRSADEPVLGTDTGWVSVGDLRQAAAALRVAQYRSLRSRLVSLPFTNAREWVTRLSALDGWVAGQLLCEADLADTRLEEFERRAGAEFRLDAAAAKLLGNSPGVVADGPTRWIIPTSGTTGVPKLVSHTLGSLTRTVKVGGGTTLRWGLLYEPTRFAGLQVLLQALAGRGSIVIPTDFLELEGAIDTLARMGCNALSATPSLWRKLAIGGLLDRLSLRVVTLGGEAADQRILDLLATKFPTATIRHIYASTEAGVGFSVADRKAGFPVNFLEQPPSGLGLRVRQEDGMLLLRPERREQTFVGSQDALEGPGGWIETGDLVLRRGERFQFLGRANGCINVGGQKVHPSMVEEVLLGVPGVQAARVYGRPNPILGALVAAEIVPERGSDTGRLHQAVLQACQRSLERFQTPAIVQFVQQLRLSPVGKLQR